VKKYITGIIMTLGVVLTLSVLLYPTVSAYINSHNQSRVVTRYLDDVANMNGENIQAELNAAREYNKRLLAKQSRFVFTDEETAEYEKLLDTGRGVMGILAVDKMNVKLPVYHGTDRGVLQIGLGHLKGTSLPVGGTGTHAFITGHRGLPSSTLLTHLDKMEEGDLFVIYVLGETLTYQVDNIKTVEHDEKRAMDIDPDMDYVTLVTCTPYSVNTHRLLVRGHRVESAPVSVRKTAFADARRLDRPMVILMLTAPVLPFVAIYTIVKCIKIHREGRALYETYCGGFYSRGLYADPD